LIGVPLFPLAGFYADLILGLAGFCRIIRHAGALLIAALFATVRFFGSRRVTGTAESHEDQQKEDGTCSHDGLLSKSSAAHCPTRTGSRDDAGQIHHDTDARAASDGWDHADLEPEDGSGIRGCAITSASECCAELGRLSV